MATTYFLAELACPACGRSAPADESTSLVTPLVMGGATFWTVGDRSAEFSWANISSSYPVLREPAPDEPIRLLERWICPHCGTMNWARITFTDNVVTAIEAVPLDVATVAGAHAIASEVAEDYYARTGGGYLFDDPNEWGDIRDKLLAGLA